jgi:O-antigen ligase
MTFALGAILFVLAFMVALARVDASPLSSLALTLAMLGAGLAGLAFLRDAPAERLILLYIFLMPLHFFVAGGSAVSIERGSFGFRMSAADLVFPALVLAMTRTPLNSGSPLRTRAILPFAALIAAIAFSWVQSLFFLETLSTFSTGKFLGLVYLVLFAAVVIEVIRERVWWERAIDAVAISGIAFGLLGLLGYLAWLLGATSPLMDYDRVTSTMWWDPNIFASFMVVSFILSLMRVRLSDDSGRWFWVGSTAVAALALFFSQSRSGLGAALVGLLLLAVWYRPSLLAGGMVAVCLAVVLLWSISVWVELPVGGGTGGVWNEGRFNPDTATSRLEFWRRGASLLPTEGVTGIGIGSFEQINPDVDSGPGQSEFARAHNTYLASILELGVTGLIALLLFAGAIVGAMQTGFQHMAPDDRWRLAGLTASLIAIMAFAVFVDALYQRHLWVLVALILAVPQVVASERRRAEYQAGSGT